MRVIPLIPVLATVLGLAGCAEKQATQPAGGATGLSVQVLFPQAQGVSAEVQRIEARAFSKASDGTEILRATAASDSFPGGHFELDLHVPPAPLYILRLAVTGTRLTNQVPTETGIIFFGEASVSDVTADSARTVTVSLEDIVPSLTGEASTAEEALSWTPVQDALRYRLKETTGTDRVTETPTSATDTLVALPPPGEGMREYRVRAEFASGLTGAYSEPVFVAAGSGTTVDGTVRNLTGSPIANVLVKLFTCAGGAGPVVYSAEDGRFRFAGVTPGSYYLLLIHSGCGDLRDPAQGCFQVEGAPVVREAVTLDCSQSVWATASLTWGADPPDLDLHLWTPAIRDSVYHVYWNDLGSATEIPFAALDHDSQQGFGPENLAIYQALAGDYTLAVHDYSALEPDSLPAASQAQVRVVTSVGVYTFPAPSGPAQPGWWWTVCRISAPDGTVEPINTISIDPPIGYSPPGPVYELRKKTGKGPQAPCQENRSAG